VGCYKLRALLLCVDLFYFVATHTFENHVGVLFIKRYDVGSTKIMLILV
jgi:hypothetical protein